MPIMIQSLVGSINIDDVTAINHNLQADIDLFLLDL
jgi:hypothetical protein